MGCPMADGQSEAPWGAVIARSLAYQAMHLAGLGESKMVEKAQFLMSLGLPREDAAALLGSSDNSLRVQLSRLKKKDGKDAD